MRRFALPIAFILACAPMAASAAVPAGIWSNPANSVHVAFKRCGQAMCGTIVWANDRAQQDAARGGTDHLIGATLFQDFVEEAPGRWRGEVFIPDVGQSVSGTITAAGPRTLIGEGCVIAGFGCKSQTWKRIK